MFICFVWIEVIDFDLGIMAEGELVPMERSAELSDRQREFLSRFLVDAAVQQLIPPSIVTENVVLGVEMVGLLLSHQPLTARFHHADYFRLNEFLSGHLGGSVRILPSGYDYDLTHSFFYVGCGCLPRTIATSQLTIPGVELAGVCVLGRREAAVFLEEVVCRCRRSSVASVGSYGSDSHIEAWLSLEPSGGCFVERSGLSEEEFLGSLRMESSLRLDAGARTWIGYVGMDWPEYFFRPDSKSSGDKG